jgi:hypothetical protein
MHFQMHCCVRKHMHFQMHCCVWKRMHFQMHRCVRKCMRFHMHASAYLALVPCILHLLQHLQWACRSPTCCPNPCHCPLPPTVCQRVGQNCCEPAVPARGGGACGQLDGGPPTLWWLRQGRPSCKESASTWSRGRLLGCSPLGLVIHRQMQAHLKTAGVGIVPLPRFPLLDGSGVRTPLPWTSS